jgi:hypothetical protein
MFVRSDISSAIFMSHADLSSIDKRDHCGNASFAAATAFFTSFSSESGM